MHADERGGEQPVDVPGAERAADVADETQAEDSESRDDVTLDEMNEGDMERLSGEGSPAEPLSHS